MQGAGGPWFVAGGSSWPGPDRHAVVNEGQAATEVEAAFEAQWEADIARMQGKAG
jgi:hypothetical protein